MRSTPSPSSQQRALIAAQHRELIAAQSGDEVGGAHDGYQAPCDLSKRAISDVVSKLVVD